MHRRRFLAVAGTAAFSASAGCLALNAPESGGHPLANTTQTVRIDDNSEGPHDLALNARQSLEFWEEHSEEYAGFEIAFEIVENDDPDIIIAYGDDPRGCENVPEYSENVLGCAPLIREGNRVDRPTTARVVAATRPFGKIRITTKHEIGHILGLDHDDDPLYIMSNQPEDRIPLYDLRVTIWETVLEAYDGSTAATHLLNHSIETYQRREYEAAAAAAEAVSENLMILAAEIEAANESTAEFEGHERVETVALDRLRELLLQIFDRITALERLATALAESARAGAAGNDAERDEALTAALGYSGQFNAIAPVQLRDVAFALGLVRGTDLDDQVVELEDEPPEEA